MFELIYPIFGVSIRMEIQKGQILVQIPNVINNAEGRENEIHRFVVSAFSHDSGVSLAFCNAHRHRADGDLHGKQLSDEAKSSKAKIA
jgi:hypothetical protein